MSTKPPPIPTTNSPARRSRGPFRTRISPQAEQLRFELLPEEEQKVLARGIAFDPSTHEVYRFFVVLESLLQSQQLSLLENLSRRLKRRSLDRADRVFVRLRPTAKDVAFIGMHPTTRDRGGQTSLDLSGQLLFKINVGVVRLEVSGIAKDLLKRPKSEIVAARTSDTAEWIFLRPYIASNADFPMQFCCVVPKDLPASERLMRCDVAVQDGKRVMEAHRKKVRFSKTT